MKNIHFFQFIAGNMQDEESIDKMAARDPEGHVLSTFGIAKIVRTSSDSCGRVITFTLRQAERDIDRKALHRDIQAAVTLRETELNRPVEENERCTIVDTVTANTAQHAQIIHKDTLVIVYIDQGLAAVESGAMDAARHSLRFAARAFEPAWGHNGVLTHHCSSYAGYTSEYVMKRLVTDIDFLASQQDLEIGDGCQVKDDEGTIYSIRKGDLHKRDVQDLISSSKKTVQRLKLLAMNPLEEGQEPDEQESFAEFSLTGDAGLKSVKFSRSVRAMINQAVEDGRHEDEVTAIVTADTVWRLKKMLFKALAVDMEHEVSP